MFFSRIKGDIWYFIYMSEMLSSKVSVTVTTTVVQDRFFKLKDQLKKNNQFKNLGRKFVTQQKNKHFGCQHNLSIATYFM